ncbi:MAG TPA: calcium/proton exchanger [Chloroflexota bacterium]|nr:calcium/proton exchanger [Chloroflexota bacterium]
MPRWLWALIPVGPLAYILSFFHLSELLLFLLSAVGIIPLAALIGKATEELGFHLGPAAGGLLNATFGNVPELLIATLAIRGGLLTLAQASIIGSVISNASLVVGISLFFGGVRYGLLRFSREDVGHHAVLMVLAVASLALPTLFVVTAPRGNVEGLSIFVAILLVVTYVAYLMYGILGFRGGLRRTPDDTFLEEQGEVVEEIIRSEGGPVWSIRLSIVCLAAATVAVALVGDVLVASVRPVTHLVGISEFFVGVVIVPLVGNVAESLSAIQLAARNKIDLSFAVASGSSIQVAVFVAPILVIVSLLWHPMTLVFNPIEIAVLALIVAIFFFVSQDGESNWLEGLQLTIIYVMAAAVFYFLPAHYPV